MHVFTQNEAHTGPPGSEEGGARSPSAPLLGMDLADSPLESRCDFPEQFFSTHSAHVLHFTVRTFAIRLSVLMYMY